MAESSQDSTTTAVSPNRVAEVKGWFFTTDDSQTALRQDIFSLQVDIRLHVRTLETVPPHLRAIYEGVVSIEPDFFSTLLLIHRLEWLRTTAQPRETVQELWNYMVGLDIEHFHVKMRALMDYAAHAVAGAADHFGQIPGESFYELYEWTNKSEGNCRRLGMELASLVRSASWLMELRDIRDAVVHRGGRVMGFGNPEDGILFQVYRRASINPIVQRAPFMSNKHVVDFQLYAAFYLAELLMFLKRLTDYIRTRFTLQQIGRGGRLLGPGTEVFHAWLTRLEEVMKPEENQGEPLISLSCIGGCP